MMDKTHATAWDQRDTRPHLTLRQLLRPSLIGMAVCGCYSYDPNFVRPGRERKKGRQYRIFGAVYRIFCLLLSLAFIAKTSAAFVTISNSPVYMRFNGITLAWVLECFSVFLISLKSTYINNGGHTKAFEFWDSIIKPEIEALEITLPEAKLLRRQRIYMTIAAIMCVFNMTGLALLGNDTFSDGYSAFFAAPFPASVAVKVTTCFILLLITLLWIIPMFYIVVLSTLLVSAFEAFNSFLKNHIAKNCHTITCKFQKIRLLHLNLSKMVSDLDSDFSYYFAVTFVATIGCSCFCLYQIIKTSMDTLSLLMSVFWLTSSLSLLGLISVFAAYVNEAAHGALDSIYYICVKDISTEQLGQLNLFLSKLTGTQIGFTTIGLLTITKEFLLTIAGVFLTYFFVLYTL